MDKYKEEVLSIYPLAKVAHAKDGYEIVSGCQTLTYIAPGSIAKTEEGAWQNALEKIKHHRKMIKKMNNG